MSSRRAEMGVTAKELVLNDFELEICIGYIFEEGDRVRRVDVEERNVNAYY
jgi:hypothetical protein